MDSLTKKLQEFSKHFNWKTRAANVTNLEFVAEISIICRRWSLIT